MKKAILILIVLALIIPISVSATWWDSSYSYKRPINCTDVTSDVPIIINGTSGVKIGGVTQYIWTKCRGANTALYYNSYTDYAVANDTTQIPMDIEKGNGTGYNPTSVWDGFALAYHLHDLSDSASGGYTLTKVSSPNATTSGIFDGGYDLDGTDDYLNTTYSNDLGRNVSFVIWINTSSGINPYSGFIYNGNGGTDNGLIIDSDDTKLRFIIQDSSCYQIITPTIDINNGVPHQLSVIMTGANDLIYIDGILQGNTTCTKNIAGFSSDWMLGSGQLGYPRKYNGILDEAWIFTGSSSMDYLNAGALSISYNNYLGTAGYGGIGAEEESLVVSYWNNGTTPILEGSSAYYMLEVNKSSLIDVNATLYVNGSSYIPTKTGTGNWTFTKEVPTPLVGGHNITYYWIMTISTPSITKSETTPSYNQEITNWLIGDCGTITNTTALTFNVYDEDTLSALNSSKLNGALTCWIYNKSYEQNFTFSKTSSSDSLGSTKENVERTGDYGSNFKDSYTFDFWTTSTAIITAISFKTNGSCSGTFNLTLYHTTDWSILLNDSFALSGVDYGHRDYGLNNYSDFIYPSASEKYRLVLSAPNISSCYINTSYDFSQNDNSGLVRFGQEPVLILSGNPAPTDNFLNVSSVSLGSSPKLCIYPNTTSLHCDGIITNKVGYTHWWYLINASVSNQSQEVSMYNYNSTANTETANINLVDMDYSELSGYIIKMMRYYPSENAWRQVQMSKSDQFGSSYFHVRQEDTDYKFIVQDYDNIKKTTSIVRFFKPTGEDIVQTIAIDTSTSASSTFTGYSYNYNKTSKIFNFTWADTSGLTTKMIVQAYTSSTDGRVLWCNKSLSSSTGTIICNLSNSAGTVFVTAYRKATNGFPLFNYLIETRITGFYDALKSAGMGNEGIFYAGILAVVIIMAGSFYPLSLLISLPVSLAFIMLLGITNFLTLTVLIGSAIMALVLGLMVKRK